MDKPASFQGSPSSHDSPPAQDLSPVSDAVTDAAAGAPALSNTASEETEPTNQRVILLGNVNVGKTTLFHRVCGKHVKVSNHPGTSISIGRGAFSEGGTKFHVTDTPGINGVLPESEDERISREILLKERGSLIAQVADGKNLRKSLLLTMQLAEFDRPMVLDINMMNEARQRGVSIDTERLSSLLGIPVIETVATEGKGVNRFRRILASASRPRLEMPYPPKVESSLVLISKLLKGSNLSNRTVGVALLAGDQEMREAVKAECGAELAKEVSRVADTAQSSFNRPLAAVMLDARLRAVDQIVSEVQTISPPARTPFSEKIGEWSRRPLTGIPIAGLVVLLMYLFVGDFGAQTLVGFFEGTVFGEWITPTVERLLAWVPYPIIVEAIVGEFGLVSVGLTLAFGVVVPVLTTFFFAFGILEDSGYLPRLSILLDKQLRKIGLNGKGILPLVLGFSCITMAILATRMLETKRERFIATFLLILGLPCAPLLAVMLVLLGGLSIWASVTVFGMILTQIIVIGSILEKILPGGRSDFILELPPMRVPRLRSLIKTTFWRIWWFTKEAIPLFLVATFILFVLDKVGTLAFLERIGEPVMTGVLGLPSESIDVVIMTMIRRESGAALLKQFSDSGAFGSVQVVVCLLVLTFLSPCVNAILVMLKERGVMGTLCIMGFVTTYALAVGAAVSWVCRAFGVNFD